MKQVNQFVKLIQNELFKAFFQKKTVVFIAFLLFVTLTDVAFYKAADRTDWRKEAEEQIINMEKDNQKIKEKMEDDSLDEMELEFSQGILEMQEEQIKILKLRLEKNIPEFAITPLKFVYRGMEFFWLITIFMVVFAANIMANEFNWGTIRQIFIKPVSRTVLFLAKYVSVVIISFSLCLLFFVTSILFGYLFFGGNSTSIYEVVVNNGDVCLVNMMTSIVQRTFINIFIICILSGISLSIAAVLRSNTLPILISIGIWWCGDLVGEVVKGKSIYKYLLTSNLNLQGYLEGGAIPYESGTLIGSIIICLLYLILILWVGRFFFVKKEVY